MPRDQEYRLMAKYEDGRVEPYFSFHSLDPAGMHKVAMRLKERDYQAFEDGVVDAWVEQRTLITTGWEKCE